MKDFLNIQSDWFGTKYQKELKKRYFTFKIALNLFLQNKGEIIVETGTVRERDDWGAGNSTVIFGNFCRHYDKHLYTVDNDQKHLDFSRHETAAFGHYITYELSDSVEYLKKFDEQIDLLYLDSLDCSEDPNDENIEVQTHALNELKAASDKLRKGSVVLVDDNLFTNGGKAKMCKEWLKGNGFILILDYKQTLWLKLK